MYVYLTYITHTIALSVWAPYVIVMSSEVFEIRINAYGMADKKVTKHGNSAHVYLPAEWVGKKVKVLLLEPVEEE